MLRVSFARKPPYLGAAALNTDFSVFVTFFFFIAVSEIDIPAGSENTIEHNQLNYIIALEQQFSAYSIIFPYSPIPKLTAIHR